MGILDWLFGRTNPTGYVDYCGIFNQATPHEIANIEASRGLQNIYSTPEYYFLLAQQQLRYCKPWQPTIPENTWDGKLWYPLANKPQTLTLWYPLS